MPIDQSFIGRVYPPTEPYTVGIEKIREFATAIGDANPRCHDVLAARAAGHPDVIAPPTFLALINMRAIDAIVNDPDLGVDYARMVHGNQNFRYYRPVRAGDEIVVETHIDDIMTRAGNDFITLRGEVRTAGGEPVATTRAQLVIRGSGA